PAVAVRATGSASASTCDGQSRGAPLRTLRSPARCRLGAPLPCSAVEEHAVSKEVVLALDGLEVTVTNPDKVFFPTLGKTKLDVVNYYIALGTARINLDPQPEATWDQVRQ